MHPGRTSPPRGHGRDADRDPARLKGKRKGTLGSANAAESMIDCGRTTQRNVKHWTSGEMGMR